jgi:hypothetical protein
VDLTKENQFSHLKKVTRGSQTFRTCYPQGDRLTIAYTGDRLNKKDVYYGYEADMIEIISTLKIEGAIGASHGK